MASAVVAVAGCGFETATPPEQLPEVFFAVDQSLTDESIASQPLTLKLSMKTDQVVTVGYSVAGGSATAGKDVNNTEGEVRFEPFQETATIALAIVDDMVEEEEEDLRIRLKSPENAELGDLIEHRLRISANKLPRVRFVTDTSEAAEGGGAQSFAIQLDTLSAEDVVVRYIWTGDAEPTDHGVTDSLVTVRANQISAPIPAPINDDLTDEENETIELTMIAQAGAVVAPGLGQHAHKILDDDPPPTIGFSAQTSSVSETTTTATLTVSLGLASEKTITVDYAAAAGGSAVAADFMLAAGTLTFPAGTTSQTVDVTITNDAIDEDDETVAIALSNATNATVQGGTHTLTITDDDAAPALEFQAASSTASEDTATHSVTLTLSAPSGKTVQTSVSLTGGTATAADLTLPAMSISIPPGTTTASFNVTIVNDAADDDNETAVLSLTGLVNASAGTQATHTITITDNDGPPSVRFDPAVGDQSGNERDISSLTYTYRVILSAPSTNQVMVDVTVGGTAMNNDYDLNNNDVPVVFAPGQTQRDIRLTISADGSNESNETVTLTLGAATNATNAGDNQSRTHTIIDDD